MESGSTGSSLRHRLVATAASKLAAYRGGVVTLLIVAAFTTLSTLGYGGVRTAATEYGYGYGYGYEYEYGPPHLIVVKHVINNDSGTASASDFTMTIHGVTAVGGNSFPGAESPGTDKEVTAGTYNVTETGPAGYVTTFSAGCSGTIALGETKTCTVTNNDIAPVRTVGFWKNHPEVIADNSLLPLKVGGYTVSTLADAAAIFDAMNCSSNTSDDAVSCLAAQLLAAELNLAKGSEPCSGILATVAAANALLSTIGYSGPSGTYTLTSAQRAETLALKDALDRYNRKGCK